MTENPSSPAWTDRERWQEELNSRPEVDKSKRPRPEYTIHYKADGTVEYYIYLTVDVSDLLPTPL